MAGDPYWKSVVLAMHMDGANASTVFKDEKGHVVTANGNAQISTAQSKFGGAAALFDGTGDFLTIPSSPDFDFGYGDWTIEFQYLDNTAPGAPNTFLAKRANSGASQGFFLGKRGTDKFGASVSLDGSTFALDLSSVSSIAGGVWTHAAFVRSGNTYTLYLNGVQEAAAVVGGAFAANTSVISIGGDIDGARSVAGYIDDLRITKGVARYTANFTPPVATFPNAPAMISGTVKDGAGALAPRAVRVHRKSDGALAGAMTSHATTGAFAVPALDASPHYALAFDSDADPYWPNVVLASHFDTDSVVDQYAANVALGLHMEGANAGTSFLDVTGKTITAVGAAATSTARARFGNSSGVFEGTTSYLTAPDSADLRLGAGAFTIEGFFSYSALPGSGVQALIAQKGATAAGTGEFSVGLLNTAGVFNLSLTLSGSGTSWNASALSAAITPAANTWYHFAVTRSGSTVYFFVDGVLKGTATEATTIFGGAGVLGIGAGPSGGAYFAGYMDDLRITKGIARYTAGFTPPSVSFGSFQDLTGKDMMISGVPAIGTVTKKYGSGALALNGAAGSCLYVQRSADFDFGSGDWTIEAYVNFNVVNVNQGVVALGTSGGAPFLLYLASTAELRIYMSSAGVWDIVSALSVKTSVPAGIWYHVAISKSGPTAYCFVDGVQTNRTPVNLPLAATPSPVTVGSWNGGANPLNGYIDDLRITKGVARYVTNFTPPERGFTAAMAAGTENALVLDNLIPV